MEATQTITGIVLNSGAVGEYDTNGGDFDLLRDSVVTAGLAGVLDDDSASLTVFAPTDDAFVGLATALGYTGDDEVGSLGHLVDSLTLLGGGDPIPLLTDVLTYHVVQGAFDKDTVVGLGDGAEIGTLQGGDVTLNLSSMPPSLGDLDPGIADPGLIGFDVMATNGIVHVLDGVLLPASVTGILSQPGTDFILGTGANENFKTRDGNDFVDAKGGKDVVNAGSGDDVVLGGGKGDNLFGRKGDDTLRGEAGNDQVRGGNGDDIVDGGAGRDNLWGGRGEDAFVFSEGYGRDKVMSFVDGVDQVDVSGFGVTGFDEIESLISDAKQGTKIDFGDGDILILSGIETSQMDQNDFIFA